MVVRITCSKVICQIVYSTIKNDRVLVAAESSELKRFGLTAGLTNYSSAYATGLLLARRLLK
jgi:large subunit ribosomal protein L5e